MPFGLDGSLCSVCGLLTVMREPRCTGISRTGKCCVIYQPGKVVVIDEKQTRRQSGRSLKQITNAEERALFVCPNSNTRYYERLAVYAYRNDITFVSPSFLRRENLNGRSISEIEIDHHARNILSRDQWKAWSDWFKYHRR